MAPGVAQTPASMHPTQEIIRPAKQVSPVTTPVSSPPPATVSTVNRSRKPNFQDEADRMRSFGSWPSTAPISKDKVARAGFYYLGSGLNVACPFCEVEIGDWHFNDVALRKHRERSPNCSYVLQRSLPDVPIDQIMRSPKKRLETFVDWPKPQIDPQRLVNAGFYYLKEGDKVRCAWCKGVIESWAPEDVPFDEHAKNFISCPFILNPPPYALCGEDECGLRSMCSTSKDPAPGSYPVGATPHVAPKHPHMVSSSSRMATFTTNSWPAEAKVKAVDLVEAGFFFLGMHDFTKCFSCDGGLCNWAEGDDPWVEHARWFPDCNFLKLNKGEPFIEKYRNLHQQMLNEAEVEAQSPEDPMDDTLRNELEFIMNSSDVEFFLKQGVPPQVVRMTLKKFMLDKGRGFAGPDELGAVLSQVVSFSKKAAPEAKRENNRVEEIPENMLCRVCMVHERGVVFLPCGHFVTCPSCAASVTECVMCRKPIVSTVRTFFS
ncbi:putative inhibitor of apoptosis [Galendromus occidentalis]|uniref:Inhibitor of apoptosis n=1 Tax=Galendromus occidentalis TaxID=34638 RepID=A0AAJ6VXF2_9ACAR|nr:putative inhibitor of apoptosis [Galendromus occidentalis]